MIKNDDLHIHKYTENLKERSIMLTKKEIYEALTGWQDAWDNHDLEGVMELLHKNILFENWTGAQVTGKENLRRAWVPWFEDHGGFHFTTEDIFIDEAEQKALVRWILDWPSSISGHEGRQEIRRGVDIIRLQDGKIIEKLTYSKTIVKIDGNTLRLT